MKFGKLENVDNVNFELPNDHQINKHFFGQGNFSSPKSNVYTGATSWNNMKWKGVLYPPTIKKKDLLTSYSRQFNAIEMNGTHYRTPSDNSIETWIAETPEDFKFCPKVLQAISHRNDMLSSRDVVNTFITQIAKLGSKLGQTFIQLPPYFKDKNFRFLEKFLDAWPQELALAVELRNEHVHASEDLLLQYFEILSKYNVTPAITDVAGRRDIMHMAIINDKVFIRWVGNGLHASDYSRIDEWIVRMEQWSKKGVKELYFMIHEPENESTPQIAEYMKQKLENNEYLVHRGPNLIKEQPNLFT